MCGRGGEEEGEFLEDEAGVEVDGRVYGEEGDASVFGSQGCDVWAGEGWGLDLGFVRSYFD